MRPPGGLRLAATAVLAASGYACASDLVAPAECIEPMVSRSAVSANPNNVLSMLVTAEVENADSIAVRFGRTGALLDDSTPMRAASDSQVVAVLGLHAETAYEARVVAFNGCAAVQSGLLSFQTAVLPPDLPAYTTAGAGPSPGYIVFAAGSYGIVIDNTGRVVWYHRFPNGPGLNFQPQPNGRYAARPAAAAGEAGQWIEINPAGAVTRTLGCADGLVPRFHDLIAQPDGSYWLLCDETRSVDLSSQGNSKTARVLGTAVQRRSATGTVLFSWSPFDHLPIELSALNPGDLVGQAINWTHGNSLDLDGDGNLLVSFRNLSEVTKIDTRTGAVIWRMGGARNQFTFENLEGAPFARQHGVRAAGAGQLLLLDNLGEPLGSRAERYAFDDSRRSARLTSANVSSGGLIAKLGGNVQALPGGFTLVAFGNGNGVEEYDSTGKPVWRIAENPGYVFRAQRIRSLYQPGVGDPR